MTDIINSQSALSIIKIGSSVVKQIQRSNRSQYFTNVSQTNVPNGAKIGRFLKPEVLANKETTNNALTQGVRAGHGIISRLKDLRSTVGLAGQKSLSSSNTELLSKKGTRFSVVNVQAQANILMGRIERLVAQAGLKGINLISSIGPVVRLQTTFYGGGINIKPLPLDQKGLGLENLDLLVEGGIKEVSGRLDSALIYANQRMNRLMALQRGIQGVSYNQQQLSFFLDDFGSNILPLGTLVNIKI